MIATDFSLNLNRILVLNSRYNTDYGIFAPHNHYARGNFILVFIQYTLYRGLWEGLAHLINNFLNHGNYLVYGLAATALWVLGIPHGFAVVHGKNRRGALVFDNADVIKDAIVLPWTFICAKDRTSEQSLGRYAYKNLLNTKL